LQELALAEADQRRRRAWRGRLSANKGAEDYDDVDVESRWSRRLELPWFQSLVTTDKNEQASLGVGQVQHDESERMRNRGQQRWGRGGG
jgi:hypothetical protein